MPLDFRLSSAQRALQADARAFAREELSRTRVLAEHLPTPEQRFAATRPIYEKAIAAGFLKRLIPQPFGGGGSGLADMAVVAEEFYAVDVNVSLTLFANLLGLMPLFLAGTPEQLGRFMPPFLESRGAPLAALANSEPAGSANFALPSPNGTRTTARLDGDSWVIDGEKHWISSATGWDARGADLLCVVCRTSAPDGLTILAVPRPERGLTLLEAVETVGHRAHLVPRFRMEGVRVPLDHAIGGVGQGRAVIDASFTGTAALVGIMAVGLLRAAFDYAFDFARMQSRGGPHPIIGHQAVGYALADAKTSLEAARQLGWRACLAMDAQEPGATELALHSKIFGSETAVRVITELMRVVGIESYDRSSSPLGGLLQDALVLPLFDGGNMGVRRRQLHELLMQPNYDALTASFGDR